MTAKVFECGRKSRGGGGKRVEGWIKEYGRCREVKGWKDGKREREERGERGRQS